MTTLTQASRQWLTRPADERFTSLDDMLTASQANRAASRAFVRPNKKLTALGDMEDTKALTIIDHDTGLAMDPTHFSFGQVATLTKAPAAYLRTLPSPLAADCINYGIASRSSEEIGVLSRTGDDRNTLAAATGPNYGRVWNSEVISALIARFGDGVSGQFRVPGEFGKPVAVTNDNTTLYASDRDMFVFLADEEHRIEVPNRRDGQPGTLARGFFVWSSEVGDKSLGVSTFLYDYVCKNRMVWGAQDVAEFRIRHTSGAPDRFMEEIAPALEAYANSSTVKITEAIEAAQARKIETDVLDFLRNRQFSGAQAQAIAAVHQAEEGRPIESIWDATTAITAYARGIDHQDARVALEREGGKLLKDAA